MRKLLKLRFLWTFLTLFIVFSLIAGGCGKKEEKEEAKKTVKQEVAQKAPEEKVIKIGAILPLTGSAAEIAEQHKMGIDFAIKELKNEGIPIRIIYEDDGNDPKMAVSAFNKLISINKINIVLSVMSATSMAIYPIAEKSYIIHLANCGHPVIASLSEWVFRNFPNAAQEISTILKFAAEKLGVKRLAVLYINDAYGRGAFDYMKKVFSEMEGEIIIAEGFEKTGKDFKDIILKVTKANPEAVYVFGYGKSHALVVKQLRELGYKGILLGSYNFAVPPTTEIVKDVLEGSYFTAPAFIYEKNEEYQKFVKRFRKETGKEPRWNTIIEYDAINMLVKAWEKIGRSVDSRKLKQTLESLGDYEGIAGLYKYRGNGEWWVKIAVNRYRKNLKFETIAFY